MDIQLKLYDELLNRFYIDRNKDNIDCYKIFTMCDLIVVNMVFKNNYLHRIFCSRILSRSVGSILGNSGPTRSSCQISRKSFQYWLHGLFGIDASWHGTRRSTCKSLWWEVAIDWRSNLPLDYLWSRSLCSRRERDEVISSALFIYRRTKSGLIQPSKSALKKYS